MEHSDLVSYQLVNDPEFDLRIIRKFSDVDNDIVALYTIVDEEFYPALSKRGGIRSNINSFFDWKGHLLVCSKGLSIAGIVGVCKCHPQWGPYIGLLAVNPNDRQKGVANILVSAAEKYLLENGAFRVTMKTWSFNNKTPFLCTKNGYLHLATLTNDKHNGVHTLVFTKTLLIEKEQVKNVLIVGKARSSNMFLATLLKLPFSKFKSRHSVAQRLIIFQCETESEEATIIKNCVGDQLFTYTIILGDFLHLKATLLNPRRFGNILKIFEWTSRFISTQNLRCKWLILDRDKLWNINHTDYYLPEFDEINVINDIAAQISVGANASFYKNLIIEMALKNKCNAVLINHELLQGIFEFHLFYKEVLVFDPYAELALKLKSEGLFFQ